MKISISHILVVVGGGLIIAPLVFLYLVYRLAAQILSEIITQGAAWDKVNFNPAPPDYYVPLCLIVGVLCIVTGIGLSLRNSNEKIVSEYQSLDID